MLNIIFKEFLMNHHFNNNKHYYQQQQQQRQSAELTNRHQQYQAFESVSNFSKSAQAVNATKMDLKRNERPNILMTSSQSPMALLTEKESKNLSHTLRRFQSISYKGNEIIRDYSHEGITNGSIEGHGHNKSYPLNEEHKMPMKWNSLYQKSKNLLTIRAPNNQSGTAEASYAESEDSYPIHPKLNKHNQVGVNGESESLASKSPIINKKKLNENHLNDGHFKLSFGGKNNMSSDSQFQAQNG